MKKYSQGEMSEVKDGPGKKEKPNMGMFPKYTFGKDNRSDAKGKGPKGSIAKFAKMTVTQGSHN